MEVRELLDKYEYNGDEAQIVFGSALSALNGTDPEIGSQRVQQLLNTMDETIPIPERAVDKPFMMSVESTFSIAGRGTVATGTIDTGKVKVNDEVELVGYQKKNAATVVTGIETFRKSLDYGEAGDNVGLLLRGLNREDVWRGQVIAQKGTLNSSRKIKANMYILTDEEGGRRKPFPDGYKPQIFLRTADVASTIHLLGDNKLGMPGDNVEAELHLNFPLPVEPGLRFAMREGGRTIAAGVISEVMDDSDLPEVKDRKKKR